MERKIASLPRFRQGPACRSHRNRREQTAWTHTGVRQSAAGPQTDTESDDASCSASASVECGPRGPTLVAETWPAKGRAKALGLVKLMGDRLPLGALIVALVMPRFGWRPVFFVGILPAVFTLLFRNGLQEPEVWLRRRSVPRAMVMSRLETRSAIPRVRPCFRLAGSSPCGKANSSRHISTASTLRFLLRRWLSGS